MAAKVAKKVAQASRKVAKKTQADKEGRICAGKTTKKSIHEQTGFSGSKGFELINTKYQKYRNSPAVLNGKQYSGHALDQMQNRGLMPSIIENTIKAGRKFSTHSSETTGFYDSVNRVRVIVNSKSGQIVTAIRGAP